MTTIAKLVDACPEFARALVAYDLAAIREDAPAMAQAWEKATIAASAFRQGAAYLMKMQESNLREFLGDHEEFNSLLETLRGVTLEMATALGVERSDGSEVERASRAANES